MMESFDVRFPDGSKCYFVMLVGLVSKLSVCVAVARATRVISAAQAADDLAIGWLD